MQQSRPITDFYGKILGYIWTDNKTKNEKVTDFSGKILGFYNYKLNQTTDFNGKILAKGNILSSLIVNKK